MEAGATEFLKAGPEESVFIDKKYPKLWNYLEQHEKAFRGREGGRFKAGKREEWKWYDLAYPRSLEASAQPKIVAQLLANSVQLAFDNEGKHTFKLVAKAAVFTEFY